MKNSVADVKILDYNLAAAYSLRITGIRRQTRIDVNQSLIHVNLFWSNFDSVFSEKNGSNCWSKQLDITLRSNLIVLSYNSVDMLLWLALIVF